ncbi:hypothetical protein LJC13_03330 [Peptostreptococcaceae bacterium OttesenSCG-928-C18]|nr:hypothetical protein [Peptostreptococcaceae bacterium OttesenSCG-928-C18]
MKDSNNESYYKYVEIKGIKVKHSNHEFLKTRSIKDMDEKIDKYCFFL